MIVNEMNKAESGKIKVRTETWITTRINHIKSSYKSSKTKNIELFQSICSHVYLIPMRSMMSLSNSAHTLLFHLDNL